MSVGMDYGHATAVLHSLEATKARFGQLPEFDAERLERERSRIAKTNWRCTYCGLERRGDIGGSSVALLGPCVPFRRSWKGHLYVPTFHDMREFDPTAEYEQGIARD